MAYALGFTKDVTDLISDMRDWHWEMVRDGGKTPSASCVNKCPPCRGGDMITTNMEKDKEYIVPLCMPMFYSGGDSCVPCYEYQPGRPGSFPSPWGEQSPCVINLWRYTPTGDYGRPGWDHVSWNPVSHL